MDKLVAYCIEHMASKNVAHQLFNKNGITFNKNDSYKMLAERYFTSGKAISIDALRDVLRSQWTPSPVDYHLHNLHSGVLKGHDWHGARPSFLHLSLQNCVRECITNEENVENLVTIGADIMKQEYFMVATHDILETIIISHFPDTIPPSDRKSVSDFVFQNIPYDLKVSRFPYEWVDRRCDLHIEEKRTLIKLLWAGADSERIRKQAEGTINNWGLNKFYVIVLDQDRWIEDPLSIITDFLNAVEGITEHISVNIDGFDASFQVIVI